MKARRVVGSLVAMMLLGTACGKGGGSSGAKIKEGGILRIGSGSTIDSMNPFIAFNSDAYIAFEHMYPFLVQYDTTDPSNLKFAPDFATSWSYTPDGLTWTFHTVPNAKWSDGQPLTAADAAWTINTVVKFQNGPTSNSSSYVAHVTGAEAPDPNTLLVHYKQSVANVLYQLQQMAILPEHIWSKYAAGDGKELMRTPNTPADGQPLVSGGPFMLASYKKDDVALFQRNPNWWGPKPHIDGFGIQYFSNSDAMITALKTGQIDFVEAIPPTDVQAVKSAGLATYIGPGLEFHELIINSNPKKTQHKELLNPLVRQAFDHAIDRTKIVQTAWLGYAQPGDSIIPPITGKWHDPSIHPQAFDLAMANQLLDQAGYQKGSDGIRVADGHPMSYEVIFPAAEQGSGDRAFQILQADFQQIGVKISQKNMDDTAAYSAIEAPIVNDSGQYTQFDMAMWDWVPYNDPDFILFVMTCGTWDVWNDSGYCNKTYDQLYLEQSAAIDPQKRLQIVYQMQNMIYNDRPYLVINYEDVREAHRKNWTGFVPSAQGSVSPLSLQTLLEVHQTG